MKSKAAASDLRIAPALPAIGLATSDYEIRRRDSHPRHKDDRAVYQTRERYAGLQILTTLVAWDAVKDMQDCNY
jgi:hypothetical protein